MYVCLDFVAICHLLPDKHHSTAAPQVFFFCLPSATCYQLSATPNTTAATQGFGEGGGGGGGGGRHKRSRCQGGGGGDSNVSGGGWCCVLPLLLPGVAGKDPEQHLVLVIPRTGENCGTSLLHLLMIHTYIHTYMHIYIYLYIYIHVCDDLTGVVKTYL